jgi:hypothetical protein
MANRLGRMSRHAQARHGWIGTRLNSLEGAPGVIRRVGAVVTSRWHREQFTDPPVKLGGLADRRR